MDDLLERRREIFAQPPAEFRVAELFQIAHPLREPANCPGMMPKGALPVLGEDEEDKNHDHRDAQGRPENLHSTCLRGFKKPCDTA